MNAGAGGPERLTLAGTAGGPLEVERLERDLASMWKAASDRSGGTAVSRACSSTLIALYPPPARPGADEVVAALSRRHPCRVLRVERGDPNGPPLSASAEAVCHLRGDRQGLICTEEIRIVVAPGAEERIPSAVRSLSLGGLPVVLLALEAAVLGTREFEATAADAHCVVVESTCAADLAPERPAGTRDLAWSRGADLRRALGVAAADRAAYEVLQRTVRLEIRFGGAAAPPAAALLLAGWFAATSGRTGSEAEGPGRMPRVEFRPEPGCTAGLQGIAAFDDGGRRVQVTLPAGARAAAIEGPGGSRLVTLRPRDRADEVIEEIHRHLPPPAFAAALACARALGRSLEA
jgi:glucose-6-phosphate dehydrogenase assembly protein OpcA